MPVLGLGVWQMPAGQTKRAVLDAFHAGYRLIDTATLYGNEQEVGEAIKASGLPRDEIFVTTKLWNTEHGYEKALRGFEESASRLGMEHVDLFLIHWPDGGQRLETWKAFEKLLNDGSCGAIGVSNFTIRHLDEIMQNSEVVPAVNQVEFHPYLYQRALLEFCKKNHIQLEAYSPLGHGDLVNDVKLNAIAHGYGRTAAQLMIRWGLQHEVVMIPKSSRRERISENAKVFDFEISQEDMTSIDSLGNDRRGIRDPANIP